jgi:hypothetical protein
VRRINPNRLVFLDEAGAHIAMGRSHVWVPRGEEYVEPRPMNWGDTLTMVGAVRRSGWVTLSTKWRAMTTPRFIAWVERRGATVRYLPPYSHDFNPIEPVWALVKKRIRARAPRSAGALRRVARAARHAVTPYHCRQFFAHMGYGNSSGNRD